MLPKEGVLRTSKSQEDPKHGHQVQWHIIDHNNTWRRGKIAGDVDAERAIFFCHLNPILSNTKVTVKEVTKGGLIAGGACALGGLILGPLGFAVGGTIGGNKILVFLLWLCRKLCLKKGCIAAIVSSNKFKPVSTIILYEMSPDTQQRLINNVKSIISNLDAGDALELLAIIQGSPGKYINLMKHYWFSKYRWSFYLFSFESENTFRNHKVCHWRPQLDLCTLCLIFHFISLWSKLLHHSLIFYDSY